MMLEACIADARAAGMKGVAAMAREGPWLTDRFLANRFEPVDTAPPDDQSPARKLDSEAAEQARGVEQVTSAIVKMEMLTQTAAASAEEGASAAEELTTQSEAVRDIVESMAVLIGA